MAALPRSWRSKAHNYYCIFKSTVFVTGLAVAQKYANYAVVGVLITFFTDTMVGVNLLESAFLTNLQEGVSGFMLISIANISGSIVPHLKIVLYSTAAYITGLILLGISAYHVIPEGNLSLYYKIIVFVIAMGTSGSQPMLEKFFQAQLEKMEEEEGREKISQRVENRMKAWKAVVWVVSLLLLYFFSSYGWQKTIVVSVSMMTVTGIFFWAGTNFYKPIELITTPLLVLLKVFKASFLKRNLQYPNSPQHFFHNDGNHLTFPPRLHFFRWVEKAAVIEFPPYHHTTPEQQVKDGRLCSVAQVKDSKLLLRMFPIWASFAGVGLVEVTANTFFPQQANNMVTDDVSISILLVYSTLSKVLVTNVFDYMAKRLSRSPKKRFTILRVCIGLFVYIFCFVLARKVEIKKLKMVEYHELQDTTATIDVNTWELGPQFLLLGCASGLAIDGLARFYDHQVPQTMKGQADVLIDGFISGFGSILSIICWRIYKRWFGDNLNSSHLDRYFFVIILVSIVNFVVCTVVLLTYPYNKVVEVDEEGGAELQEVVVAVQTAVIDTAGEELQEMDTLGVHGVAAEENLEPQVHNIDEKEDNQ